MNDCDEDFLWIKMIHINRQKPDECVTCCRFCTAELVSSPVAVVVVVVVNSLVFLVISPYSTESERIDSCSFCFFFMGLEFLCAFAVERGD